MDVDPTTTESLIAAFAAEENIDRLKDIAIALSKPGATNKAAGSPEFKDSLLRVVNFAIRDDGITQLKALSLLGRLRQQAKSLSGFFNEALESKLHRLNAPASELSDPLDRTHLAQMLQVVAFPEKGHYLANFIASEPPVKTDARQIATNALLQTLPNASNAFEMLGDELARRKIETADPHTTKARLLSRTLEAIFQAVSTIDVSVDPTIGETYARFIDRALSPKGPIEGPARDELGQNILTTLAGFIRPHFSLIREPHTFEAVRTAHKLFYPARWPKKTEKPRQTIALLLREAIKLIAQMGITDSRLKDTLVLVTDQHAAKNILREIAGETSGLSNDIIHWLETGQSIKKLEAEHSVAENILDTVDRDLARCFRDALALSLLKERISSNLSTSLEPELANQVQDLMTRIDRLVRDCEVVAAERGMQTRLHVGDIVEYSAQEHELEAPIAGSRMVRVASPAVVRAQEGSQPRIILKAEVFPD